MTITEFLNDKINSTDITNDMLYFKRIIEIPNKYILINDKNILNKYNTFLNDYKQTITFTDKEFIDFRYNPKKLSYVLYDTTEFWGLILQANEMYSVADFNKKSIYVYSIDSINELLSEILNIEDEYITNNISEISNKSNKLVI